MYEFYDKIVKIIAVMMIAIAVLWVGSDIKRTYDLYTYPDIWAEKETIAYLEGVEVDLNTIDLTYYNWDYDKEANIVKLTKRYPERVGLYPVVIVH